MLKVLALTVQEKKQIKKQKKQDNKDNQGVTMISYPLVSFSNACMVTVSTTCLASVFMCQKTWCFTMTVSDNNYALLIYPCSALDWQFDSLNRILDWHLDSHRDCAYIMYRAQILFVKIVYQ